MSELSCGIVRDLLPSVADGVAGAETNAAVARHVETCADCRRRLEAMRAPGEAETGAGEREIDFLKTAKRKHRRALAAVLLAVCLLAAGIGGGAWYLRDYRIGSVAPLSAMTFSISFGEPDTGTVPVLIVTVQTQDPLSGVAKLDGAYADGTLSLEARLARRSDRNPGQATYALPTPSDLTRVAVNGEIVWENGLNISEETRRVFAAAHPYVGDMTLNAESARALGIGAALGGYTNELQTSQTPYIWTMALEREPAPGREGVARAKMAVSAVALLATIENLDVVAFRYSVAGTAKRFVMTASAAELICGGSVKEAGKTLSGLQDLLDRAAARGDTGMLTDPAIENGNGEQTDVAVPLPDGDTRD